MFNTIKLTKIPDFPFYKYSIALQAYKIESLYVWPNTNCEVLSLAISDISPDPDDEHLMIFTLDWNRVVQEAESQTALWDVPDRLELFAMYQEEAYRVTRTGVQSSQTYELLEILKSCDSEKLKDIATSIYGE